MAMNKVLKYLPKQIGKCTTPTRLLIPGSFQSINSSNMISTDTTPIKQEVINIRAEQMKNFIEKCNKIEARSMSTIDDLQKKITSDFAQNFEQPANRFHETKNKDISELIALSCTDSEIDFLVEAVRKHALSQKEVYQINYGRDFITLLVSLKKTEKLLEIAKDKNNNIIMRHYSTMEMILNYLLEEKMYQEIFEILIDRLPKYVRIVNRDNVTDYRDNKKLKKVSYIPFNHIEKYTRALLLQNTEKSYFMFKELIDYVYKNDGEVSKFIVLRLLYFSIIMRHPKFGYDIFYTDLFANDQVLKSNLFIMLHSRSNREELVIRNLKNIFNKNIEIYPFTFKVIREDINHHKSSIDYKNHIDLAFKRSIRRNRLCKQDFPDIIYGLPSDSLDIFGTSNDNEESTHQKTNTIESNGNTNDRETKENNSKEVKID